MLLKIYENIVYDLIVENPVLRFRHYFPPMFTFKRFPRVFQLGRGHIQILSKEVIHIYMYCFAF